MKFPIGVSLWCGLSLRCSTKGDGFCSDGFQTLVAVRWGAFMGSLSLRATPRPQLIIGEDRMRVLPYLTTSLYNYTFLNPNQHKVKISKVSVTDGLKSPKNYFNKYLTLWTCQTYLENMFTALKSKEIIFEALFVFLAKTASVTDVFQIFP